MVPPFVTSEATRRTQHNMFSTVSGLGRLFHSASSPLSSQTAKPQRHYDSVVDETVTHDLLYPQDETLSRDRRRAYPLRPDDPTSVAAAARSADDRGGFHVRADEDVRVLVVQQIHDVARILYDTRPALPATPTRMSPPVALSGDGISNEATQGAAQRGSSHVRRAPTTPHSRQPSLTQIPHSMLTSPTSPRNSRSDFGGLFGGSRSRGLAARPATNDGESAEGKMVREDREGVDDLLNCIFGAPGFPSTSMTKIHVRRSDPEGSTASRPTSPRDGRSGSLTAPHLQRASLPRSHTAESLTDPSAVPPTATQRQPSQRGGSYILITKLFSLDPEEIRHGPPIPRPHEHRGSGDRPRHGASGGPSSIAAAPADNRSKQISTPTFAVALLVYIPTSSAAPTAPSSPSALPTADPRSRLGDCWSKDTGSARKRPSLGSDLRIAFVLDQLPTLIRSLANLELIARCTVIDLLAQQYMTSASRRRQVLQLAPSALQHSPVIDEAAENLSSRIVAALQIPPVIIGQGRWALWKEVARGTATIAGDGDRGCFLSVLLTSFLTYHTDWLGLVAPKAYRRRHLQSRGKSDGDVEAVRERTVIVSPDKMAARRMLFLLSIFLPGDRPAIRSKRRRGGSPAVSSTTRSASPPYGVSIPRRRSLRRTINARTPTVDGAGFEGGHRDGPNDWSTPLQTRRASDATSIRSLALPISSAGTRKSSTTTTATIIPEPQQAVPLFTSFSPEAAFGTSAEARPGSSGSIAALRLQRTLSRTESNEHSACSTDSQGRGRWGSTRSGFWSSRRGSSTENSDVMASSGEGLGISGVTKLGPNHDSASRLGKMVKDADLGPASDASPVLADNRHPQPEEQTPSSSTATRAPRVSPLKPVLPSSSPPEPFPLMLSVDEQDGVIDVQYSPTKASVEPSPVRPASKLPRRTGTALSGSSERSSLRSPRLGAVFQPAVGSGSAARAAGWLRAFHPDFALQGVCPYDSLKNDIKISMRTEPTPTALRAQASVEGAPGWTDVCTTLIADPASSSVTRLTLQRRDPSSQHHRVDALLGHRTSDNADERFIEEPMLDRDGTLAAALERVLSAKPVAHASSPAAGRRKRETKSVMLNALGRIAKSVAAELDGDDDAEGATHTGVDAEPPHRDDSTLRQRVRKLMTEAKTGD